MEKINSDGGLRVFDSAGNSNEDKVEGSHQESNDWKCCVNGCSVTMREILGRFDNGTFSMIFCPNHQIMYVIGMINHSDMVVLPSKLEDKRTCSLCKEQAIIFDDYDATYELCSSHMEKLIRKNLTTREFSELYLKHRNTFLLHDDFYDSKGKAIQPME